MNSGYLPLSRQNSRSKIEAPVKIRCLPTKWEERHWQKNYISYVGLAMALWLLGACELKDPYEVKPTFHCNGLTISYYADTNFPDGTIYRAVISREIKDVGSLHEVRYNNAGYFYPDSEAVDGDPLTFGKTLLGVIRNSRLAGRFEMFSPNIQAYPFWWDPKLMIIDRDRVRIEFEVSKDMPGQPKAIRSWLSNHLFFKSHFYVPYPLQ